MKRYLLLVLAVGAVAAFAFPAASSAQSGHFVGTQTCTDIGTQVSCDGKVAGLGGTTFSLTVSAQGSGSVTCTNPGGNVAPGQSFTTTVSGSSGPVDTPRNGQFRFNDLTTNAPTVPAGSCPNRKWTPSVDVDFTTATITLRENGAVSDTIAVPVS
jgi:hypothetical protein